MTAKTSSINSLFRQSIAERSPIFLILAAAGLFGTTGSALAQTPVGSDPLVAGALRLLIGGAVLVLLARKHIRPLLRHPVLIMTGSLCVGSYQLCFFYATDQAGVAVATMLTIAASPLMARFIGGVRKRPAPSHWWNLAAGILLAGVALLSFSNLSTDSVHIPGMVAAFLAGSSFALYTEHAAVLIERHLQPTAVLGGMFFSAGIITAPILIIQPVTWVTTARGAMVIVYLGVITLALAYVAFGRGLARLAPTTVIMLTLFEPIVATLLASTVLHEDLSSQSMIGMVVILGGLIIVGLSPESSIKATNDQSELEANRTTTVKT